MWRFLLGKRRVSLVLDWEKENPTTDPMGVYWFDVISNIPWIAVKAANVLRKMGHEAKFLAYILQVNSKKLKACHDALIALNTYNGNPNCQKAVPTLIQVLPQKEWLIQSKILKLLGHFGGDAKEALPTLKNFIKEQKQDYYYIERLKTLTEEAIQKIEN